MSASKEGGPSLSSHLECVARLAYSIGGYILPGNPASRLCGALDVLLGAAVLAGALHDLGKASPYYARKDSFYMHEYASAMVALEAARIADSRGMWRLAQALHLAALAISRHHSAMEGRHPHRLSRDKDGNSSLRRAVNALSHPGFREAAASCIPPVIRGDAALSSIVEEAIAEAHGNAYILSRDYVREALVSPVSRPTSVYGFCSSGARSANPRALMNAAVAGVAGVLIMADILVAVGERRRPEDAPPVYADWWRRELEAAGLALNCEDVDEAGPRSALAKLRGRATSKW